MCPSAGKLRSGGEGVLALVLVLVLVLVQASTSCRTVHTTACWPLSVKQLQSDRGQGMDGMDAWYQRPLRAGREAYFRGLMEAKQQVMNCNASCGPDPSCTHRGQALGMLVCRVIHPKQPASPGKLAARGRPASLHLLSADCKTQQLRLKKHLQPGSWATAHCRHSHHSPGIQSPG